MMQSSLKKKTFVWQKHMTDAGGERRERGSRRGGRNSRLKLEQVMQERQVSSFECPSSDYRTTWRRGSLGGGRVDRQKRLSRNGEIRRLN